MSELLGLILCSILAGSRPLAERLKVSISLTNPYWSLLSLSCATRPKAWPTNKRQIVFKSAMAGLVNNMGTDMRTSGDCGCDIVCLVQCLHLQ